MHTFLVRDGDLVIASGGFATVSGQGKVRQDLGLASVEPIGSDRFHPRWGSELPSLVGTTIAPDVALSVQTEVRRIVANYIAVQADQIQRDQSEGRASRYEAGEVVVGVNEIQVKQEEDRLRVRIVIDTLSQGRIALTSAVGV